MSSPLTSLEATLRQLGLLTSEQEASLSEVARRFAQPQELVRELVQRGWLTPLQANRLSQGRGQELVLGPYVLLDKLGSGGMGEVFKAKHRLMDRIVALKVIKQESLDGTLGVQRFQREIKAAARLVHPNIVMAYDADQVDGNLFFVMEYVAGLDLHRLIKQRGPLPVTEACQFIQQAAQGLEHAHQHGLVHRDIKPGNLMVSQEGERGVVKLLDLGLARFHQATSGESPPTDLSAQGGILGTPDFMAPEQIADSSRADIRSDIYSLGCTLHYLLAGQVPFPAGNLLEKLRKHEREAPPMLEQIRPEIPEALGAVTRRMMAKDPGQRFQTPTEVVAALARFIGPTISAAPLQDSATIDYRSQTSRPGTLVLSPHRPPWVKYGVAGVGLLLGLILVLVFWPRSPAANGTSPLVHETNKDQKVSDKVQKDPKKEEIKGKEPNPIKSPKVGDSVVKNLAPVKSRRFLGHVNQVRLVAFLDEGRKLVSFAYNEILIWDVNDDRKELKKVMLSNLYPGAISPDGKTVLARDNGHLKFWLIDLETGDKKVEMGEKMRDANSLEFSSDGKLALSAGQDHITRLWNLEKREEERRFEGHRACFSSSGKTLLTAVGKIKNIPILWNAADGNEIQRGPEYRNTVLSLALAPDERHALLAGEDALILLDMNTGKEVGTLNGHEGWVNTVVFSKDGKFALSGGFDKTIRLWDVAQRKELHKMVGHTSNVTSLAFSPCGRYVASGANDQTVRLWALPEK